MVIGDGLQLGDVADTFGDALSEEHLSPDLQILWVLDELEENHGFLPSPQLLLQERRGNNDTDEGCFLQISDEPISSKRFLQMSHNYANIGQGNPTEISRKLEELLSVGQLRVKLSGCTHLPVHGLHRRRLPHIPDVHSDLEALVEGLGVEKQHNLCLKFPADRRFHLRTHHHHTLPGER